MRYHETAIIRFRNTLYVFDYDEWKFTWDARIAGCSLIFEAGTSGLRGCDLLSGRSALIGCAEMVTRPALSAWSFYLKRRHARFCHFFFSFFFFFRTNYREIVLHDESMTEFYE